MRLTGFGRWSYHRGKCKSPCYFPFVLNEAAFFINSFLNYVPMSPAFILSLSSYSAWLAPKFGQSHRVGDVVINQRHRVADTYLLGRTASNVAPHLDAFRQLDNGNIVRHIRFPCRPIASAHFKRDIDSSFAAHRSPLRLRRMAMRTQGARRVTESLAVGTTLQSHRVIFATFPKSLRIVVG